jgi:Carbohydrate-binding module 48 (Isoamylase N-terminal domain)
MGTRLRAFSRIRLMAILAVALLAYLGGCAKPPIMKADVPKRVVGAVRFTVLAPGAQQVFLVGSFNGWTKGATPMKIAAGSALWSVDIPLKEGEYTFMYLIDGARWMTPPLAQDFVIDGFGQTNGVVIVR